MALITSISELSKERGSVHDAVECTACVLSINGRKLLQLDTLGRPDRKVPGKVSQSVQFDIAGAQDLLHLIHRTFPDLRGE